MTTTRASARSAKNLFDRDAMAHNLNAVDGCRSYLTLFGAVGAGVVGASTCVEINQCVGCRPGSVERRGTGIATPSSRRRVDGVEDDAKIQH